MPLNPWGVLRTTEGTRLFFLPLPLVTHSTASAEGLDWTGARGDPLGWRQSGCKVIVQPCPEPKWQPVVHEKKLALPKEILLPSVAILSCTLLNTQIYANCGCEWCPMWPWVKEKGWSTSQKSGSTTGALCKVGTIDTLCFVSNKSSFTHALTFWWCYKICSRIFGLHSWPSTHLDKVI